MEGVSLVGDQELVCRFAALSNFLSTILANEFSTHLMTIESHKTPLMLQVCNEKTRSFILLTFTASLLQQLLTRLIAPHVFELGFATRPKNACHVTGTGNRQSIFL